jgi:hypothetical protein
LRWSAHECVTEFTARRFENARRRPSAIVSQVTKPRYGTVRRIRAHPAAGNRQIHRRLVEIIAEFVERFLLELDMRLKLEVCLRLREPFSPYAHP